MQGWSRASAWLAGFSGFGAGLLPAGICPACWPATAGILSSVGVGFSIERSLLLVAAGLLLVSIVALGFGARGGRGYGPLALGAVAALGVLGGRFWIASDAIAYASIFAVLTAAVWNAWPRVAPVRHACGSCERAGAAS